MNCLRPILFAGLVALLSPSSTFACAVCYGGDIDSPMADGMNWGIFTLLGVVGAVAGSFLFLLIHLIRKSEAMTAAAEKNLNSSDL